MAEQQLSGTRVAVLVADGFEQVELAEPLEALRSAGAHAEIVSPAGEEVRAWNVREWGERFEVDVPLRQADPGRYAALVLPGGVMNADRLRTDQDALRFVRGFFDRGRPVAVICHAPWVLIDAQVIRGRRVTSYPSLRVDLQNAGAEWVDEEVVVDQGLVSSRTPDDLPAFCRKMVEEFAEGHHRRPVAA